jgi:prepilin-type N-terminal cleavage/methylation domain-containing protein
VQVLSRTCRGFTLIELIATITIIAIIAAVALPREPAAIPFLERGYADGVAAALRHARVVALASRCEVQFTIDAAGYRAQQRALNAATNHCLAAGPWATAVRRGDGAPLDASQPAGVVLAANRQFVFSGTDGRVAGGPIAIDIGTKALTVDASGIVQGP